MRTQAPLLAPIFRSDGQARLLATLILTGDELSIFDLAERSDLAYATAHREVLRLVDAGILRSRYSGHTRLVSPNPASPLVSPLREILLIVTGPVPMLREELSAIDGIARAFLYGSFASRLLGIAGPDPRDIDVMVIGDVEASAVFDACARVELQMKRPVNPSIMSAAEFMEETPFLQNVRERPTVPILGEAL